MVYGASMPTDIRTGTRGAQDGAALAELTIVVPIMLVLLLVVFDFGQGFLAYISVTNGARDGARAAAQIGTDCVGDKADIKSAATDGASPYVVDVPDPIESGGLCEVTVNYTYVPILPFVTSPFSLPIVGQVGPLWDGTMSETMRSK